MINNRDSFRLRRLMDLNWSIPGQRIEGRGKIFNLSLTGMSFETDRLFDPEHGMTIAFKSPEIIPLPAQGLLAWFKKVGENGSHFQCGIRFLKDNTGNQSWSQWMDENILKLADTADNRILNRLLGAEEEE